MPFLVLGKGDFIKNPFQPGYGYAVVGDGDSLFPGSGDAAEDIPAVEHACPAVDNETVRGKVIREIRALWRSILGIFTLPMSSDAGAWVQASAMRILEFPLRCSNALAPSVKALISPL